MCHHISPSGLLHELPPHSSWFIIAGTSHVSWKASVLWSNLMGQTSPTSLITRCLNEWMYEDVSVTVHMSWLHSFASDVFRSLLCIGTVQGSTDIYLVLVQNSSDNSIYCYPIITLQHVHVGVTLECWTPFSSQTLVQMHLSTRLHSSHPSAEICSEWLLDLEQLLMANSNPWGFKGHWYLLT